MENTLNGAMGQNLCFGAMVIVGRLDPAPFLTMLIDAAGVGKTILA